jgi:LAGLIDADG endonuclease
MNFINMIQRNTHLFFFRSHAKIFSLNKIQKGQFAWSTADISIHVGHQRLHARNLHFAHWLVGFTDGDGCFSIVKSNDKFHLNFSISQSVYNIRVLAFIKQNIGVGSISISKHMAVYRIRNAKHLASHLWRIFDNCSVPLQTFKRFHAYKLKLATLAMLDANLTTEQKRDCLALLRTLQVPDAALVGSQSCAKQSYECKHNTDFKLDDDWIIGFMEAEGSFFITKKDEDRFTCAFAITQKKDKPVLEAIRKRFFIKSKVQWRPSTESWHLETSNLKALWCINDFVRGKFRGMKSLEYKLWSRALYYQSSLSKTGSESHSFAQQRDFKQHRLVRNLFEPVCTTLQKRAKIAERLEKIQSIMRKLKIRHKSLRAN